MNSGATAERVYDALKRRIMQHGFRPGDRLDPAVLAETLSSSVTPVRDALHILTGEGLIETRTNSGFHLPLLDEPALRDLYSWSNDVLALALRNPLTVRPWQEAMTMPADRIGTLFFAIADAAGNREQTREIASLNHRLHAARMVEPVAIENIEDELAAMIQAYKLGDRKSLRSLLARYHRRRQRLAASIVRLLYRSDRMAI